VITFLRNYVAKMRGGKRCPPRAPVSEMIWSVIGAFFGIAGIYFIGHLQGLHLQDSLF